MTISDLTEGISTKLDKKQGQSITSLVVEIMIELFGECNDQ